MFCQVVKWHKLKITTVADKNYKILKIEDSIQTDEAGIKAEGHFQRVRAGESRAERWLLNGPLRAQWKEFIWVFCDVGHTLVAGNMLVFRESTGNRKARWYRGEYLCMTRPWQ